MVGTQWLVGVSVRKENLEKFKQDINKYIEGLELQEIKPILNIDMEVMLKDLTTDTVKELEKLEPFGEANDVPIFIIKNLKIESIRAITEGKHLKLRAKDENNAIDVIGFNFGEYADEYRLGDRVDIVGTLDINSYNGMENIQMNLKDIKKSL